MKMGFSTRNKLNRLHSAATNRRPAARNSLTINLRSKADSANTVRTVEQASPKQATSSRRRLSHQSDQRNNSAFNFSLTNTLKLNGSFNRSQGNISIGEIRSARPSPRSKLNLIRH